MGEGRVAWYCDAAHEFTSINGIAGSFSATGPTGVDGI